MDLELLTDEELIVSYKKNNLEALSVLINRYKNLLKSLTRSYFLQDGDREDLLQEASIGFVNAVNTYNGESPFKNYACLCVKNAVFNAVNKSNRNNNKPLNNYISIDSSQDDDIDKTNITVSSVESPETGYINKERVDEINKTIEKTLSSLEYKILILFLKGFSYKEIGEKLGKTDKSIDNAMQRIRKKLQTRLKV